MVGEECIRPVRAKHSDWCGLAGIVQAIVEIFPKNCAPMFPPAPAPPSVASFSGTFRPQSSDNNDDDDNYDAGSNFRRFDSSLSMSIHRDPSRTGQTGHPYTSTHLLHGGAFCLSTDPKEPPSSSLGAAPDEDEERGSLLGDNNLDMGQEADDEEDGEKDPTDDKILPDPSELELLQGIINPAAHNQPPLRLSQATREALLILMAALPHQTHPLKIWTPRVHAPRRRDRCLRRYRYHIPVSGRKKT